jgi:fructokinase
MRRKPTVLAGVEGGGTTWKAAIALGSPENIVAKTSVDTTTPRETLDKVRQWLVQQIAEYGRFDSLGVASFGPIDAKVCSSTYGYITTTPKTGWQVCYVVNGMR